MPPLLLAGAAGGAWREADERRLPAAPPPRSAPPVPELATPVLSARRVPEVLGAEQRDDELLAEVDVIAGRLPAGSCLRVDLAGSPLYRLRADQPLVPASNMKVATAFAALEVLGPDTRLRTELRAVAPPVDGVVDGDLWLVGGGDPLLATADWARRFSRPPEPRTSVEAFADAIAASGLRVVRGRLLGDDSRFDRLRVVPTWPDRYRTERQSGPLSALTVNDGFVVDPERPDRADPAADPAAAAAQLLVDLLAERGVRVEGGAGSAVAPVGAVTLAAAESAPMRELVAEATRESDNGTAELLLKEIGLVGAGEGSTAAGTRVVMATLVAAGLPTAGLVVADGSGLDPTNTLTCDLLVALYGRAGASSDLVQGLSLAGEDGTLARRFAGTPVQGRMWGKSGSIRNVSTLSGVARGGDGTVLAFALMVNDPEADDIGPTQWEALSRALVRYPGTVDVAGLEPRPVLPPG